MNVKQIRVVAFLTGLLALAACEHEDIDRQHYDNKLFISAASKTNNEMLVDTDDTSIPARSWPRSQNPKRTISR